MRSCARCDRKLPLGRRLVRDTFCEDCEREVREISESELEDLRLALSPLQEGPLSAVEAIPSLEKLAPLNELDPETAEAEKVQAVKNLLDKMMVGGRMETWHFVVARAVGKPLDLCQEPDWGDPHLLWRMRIGRSKAGLPFSVPMPDEIAAQRDEMLHWRAQVVRLQEQIDREIEFDQSGASVDLTDRVSLQRGTMRGREVEVGRRLVSHGEGQLYITSQRIVFSGTRSSESIDGTQLLGVQVFNDGIQFRTKGADEDPMFKIPDPNQAAMVGAATEFMVRSVQGNPILPDESQIPDFPKLDAETERLIAAAGLTEIQTRQARLVGITGGEVEEIFGLDQGSPTEQDHEQVQDRESGVSRVAPGPTELASPSNFQFEVENSKWLDVDAIHDLEPLGKFLLVEFRIRSSETHVVQLAARHIRLCEKDGTQYEPWTGGAENLGPFRRTLKNVFVIESLQPKLWHKGSLVYDLPSDRVELERINLPSRLS